MSAGLVRGNAVMIPLRSESVDLIVTSPPYFSLRSYRDAGEHYDGQIGSEPTPQAFLEALWSVMHECWRVLKPSGVCFVNLGDKRVGSGGHNNAGLACTSGSASGSTLQGRLQQVSNKATRRNAPDRYNQAAFGRVKSKMLLPHRFAIGCEDGLADPEGKGWIVRQDLVWSKPNGLPESVTDRPRDSHEMWFMLTKEGRYYSAVDEVREAQVSNLSAAPGTWSGGRANESEFLEASATAKKGGWDDYVRQNGRQNNPLGKLPGSVWTVPSEPLRVPDWARERLDLPDHFAAFPQEWPRRLILGWSPPGVCVECGEGRRPVVEKKPMEWRESPTMDGRRDGRSLRPCSGTMTAPAETTVIGYACACPSPTALTTPAVVLDPFVGTGTVPMVARALGRYGVGIDLSADYLRLARWRTFESGHVAKAVNRTNGERQGVLL